MKVDAVITSLEMNLEAPNSPFGTHIAFRFIDIYPYFYKTNDMLYEIRKRKDVYLIDYDISYTGIHENTDITDLEVTKH
tara:strand:+ start:469 stop:705 length:237 start_codon:yes stop_codon:yes gene_type:complete